MPPPPPPQSQASQIYAAESLCLTVSGPTSNISVNLICTLRYSKIIRVCGANTETKASKDWRRCSCCYLTQSPSGTHSKRHICHAEQFTVLYPFSVDTRFGQNSMLLVQYLGPRQAETLLQLFQYRALASSPA